jgi:hypothetical protein
LAGAFCANGLVNILVHVTDVDFITVVLVLGLEVPK